MATREVEIIIELVDKFTSDAKTIEKALGNLNETMRNSAALEKQAIAGREKASRESIRLLRAEVAAYEEADKIKRAIHTREISLAKAEVAAREEDARRTDALNKKEIAAYKEKARIGEELRKAEIAGHKENAKIKEAALKKSIELEKAESQAYKEAARKRATATKNQIQLDKKEIAAHEENTRRAVASFKKRTDALNKSGSAAVKLQRQKKAAYKADEAEAYKIQARYKRIEAAAKKAAAAQIQSAKKVATTTATATKSIGLMYAAYKTKQIVVNLGKAADAWTNMGSKIRVVASQSESYKDIQQEIVQVALRSRTSLESTAKIYQRIAVSQRGLNLSSSETLRIVETINKSLVLYGASASEAQAATVQLSQAFASGVLRGDEFRSVAESGVGVLKIFADHLGMSVGELRNFAYEGKLTADVMREALIGAVDEVDEAFEKVDVTFSTAAENFRTGWIKLIGTFGETTGVTKTASKGVQALATIMRELTASVEDASVESSEFNKELKDVDVRDHINNIGELSKNFDEMKSSADESKDEIKKLKEEVEDMGSVITMTSTEIVEYGRKMDKIRKLEGNQAKSANDLTAAYNSLLPAFARISKETGIAITNVSQFNNAIENGTIILDNATKGYKANADALKTYSATMVESFDGVIKVFNKLSEIGEKEFLAGVEATLNGLTEESVPAFKEALEEAAEAGKISAKNHVLALNLINDKFKELNITVENVLYSDEERATIFDKLAKEIKGLTEDTMPAWIDKIGKAIASGRLLKAEGLSLRLMLVGMRKDFFDAGEAAEKLTKNIESLGESFGIAAATSYNEIAAIAHDLQKLHRAGKITDEELDSAMAHIQVRLGELADTAEEELSALRESFRKGETAADGLRDSIDGVNDSLDGMAEKAASAVDSLDSMYREQREPVIVNSLAKVLYDLGERFGLVGAALADFVSDNKSAMWDEWIEGGQAAVEISEQLLDDLRERAGMVDLADLPPPKPFPDWQPGPPVFRSIGKDGYLPADPMLIESVNNMALQISEQNRKNEEQGQVYRDGMMQLYNRIGDINVVLDGEELSSRVLVQFDRRMELQA